MLQKIVPSVAAISVLLLAGCSNTSNLEQQIQSLNNKVDALTTKVDSLSTDVSSTKNMTSSNNQEIKMLKAQVINLLCAGKITGEHWLMRTAI